MECIDEFEEIYTYNSLEEREAAGEFDEPSLKQKYDFDLTCKKFIESSKVLDVLSNITPDRMLELIQNNKNYEDFQIPLLSEMEEDSKINELSDISILSDKNKNNHFNILQNTDVSSVIDKSIIEENVSQIFLSEKIKDFNFISKDKVNQMYKNLIRKMDINIEDKNIHTYFNENDKYKEKFITEVNLKSLGIDDFVRLETSCLDGIKKVADNIDYLDKKVLALASKEEMLEKDNSIYPSLKKLYDVVYGENYFENEDEFKEQVKNDLKYDYLSINHSVNDHTPYLWLIDNYEQNYIIKALDSTKPIIEGKEAEELFGTEISEENENKKITFELGSVRYFSNYFSTAISNSKCENGERIGIYDFINDFSEGQKLLSPILEDMSGITLGELNEALEKEGFKKIEFIGKNGLSISEKTTLSTLDRMNENERLRKESPEIYKKVKSNEEEM